MSRLVTNKLRDEVVGLIRKYRHSLESFEYADDYSILTFRGRGYACKVTLNEKWIGYDLKINTPEGARGIQIEVDTDNYPIDRAEHEWFAQKIYNDLRRTVEALLTNKVSYRVDTNETYYARQNEDGTYYLKHSSGRGRWIFKYVQIEENEDASETEISNLKLVSVS